jgi:hypothetical protein
VCGQQDFSADMSSTAAVAVAEVLYQASCKRQSTQAEEQMRGLLLMLACKHTSW